MILLYKEEYFEKNKEELINKIFELQSKLDEADETLNAIRSGEIDAIVTNDSVGSHVYTLESADYLYRVLVQEMSEGIVTLTLEGVIFYTNTKFASMVQIPMETLTGKKFNDFVVDEDITKFEATFKRGSNGKSKAEINLKSVKGTIIPVLISIKTLNDLKGVYAVITDISEHKHYEELKIIQKELKNTLLELERSNAELEKFAYVASHDLQEPLRMVSSFTQLLEKNYKGKLDSDADEFIHYAVDGAKRMHELINDLLSYSRVTSHGKIFGPVNLDDVLEQVLINLKVQIEENDAVIVSDPLPTVSADYSQMVQLFQNLIGNAIKYRGDEKPIINITVDKRDGELILVVSDNGIGIESKHQERIFEIFQRLQDRDKYQGTGIGLSICKKIVERHNGSIWVESVPGNGSDFYCTFPIRFVPDL